MFDLLKKKVSSFVNSITNKAEEKIDLNLSLETKAKAIFSNEIELKEKDVDDLLENLEMSLLESDVAYEVSQEMVGELKGKLVGAKFHKGKVKDEVKNLLKSELESALNVESKTLLELVKSSPQPFVILFLGPNGAGKTTTIAKLSVFLSSHGLSSVIAASDTFRAAAIEQIMEHGKKTNTRVIKHDYGADPAAVAFDAINAAKASKAAVVLIDTAGRQDTNLNLIEEMKKINRVVKPSLKIFIGESIAGNALLDQISKFNEAIKVDAVILTKMDCDAKGGSSFSITKGAKIPILFVGLGQKYEDLTPFKPSLIVDAIFGNN
ncbi:Signal recognition particle receptor FtsY [Candidatus Gugararchaeum adminiculabundum]|nr:Signal recognition particle receptor FtsY [Candidatus Gugararchaeum adminiculabundum]